jgi:flagellar hook-associated protein 1 FlgK
MGGGFVSLNTALSALYAQQHGLDVTGQNVANVNTEGYSRQRVRFDAIGAPSGAAIHSTSVSAGQGVKTTGFERLRDAFLERRALQEHAADAGLRANQTVLDRVERSFSEPGENGIQAQMSKFWSAWDDVANRPGDPGARSQLVEVAATLAGDFNRVASDLTSLRSSVTSQLQSRVGDVNELATMVAELNGRIQTAVSAGTSPNDLLDKRDDLVAQIGALVGVTTRDGPAGTVDVYLGGTALVRGSDAESLAVSVAAGGSVTIGWPQLNTPAEVTDGEVGALTEAVNSTIPGYQAQLDGVADTIRDAVNVQHAAGANALSPPTTPTDDFFTGAGAAGMAVNAVIVADPQRVAAAAAGAGSLDGSNAQAIALLGESATGPDSAYRSLITALGVDAQRANRRVDMQADITMQVDTARQAQSSVSLDEEMTNMLGFQHAYEAAARLMTTVDQMLSILMQTGVVGR